MSLVIYLLLLLLLLLSLSSSSLSLIYSYNKDDSWHTLVIVLQGFILLAVQAHISQLRPPHCNMGIAGEPCLEAKGYKAWIFFLALCLVALGSGCLKPNIISLGADQFQKDDPEQSKKLSTYFNCAYFAFCTGELFALTVLVWVQTQSGMDVGFAVSAAAMAVGLISLLSGTLVYRNKLTRGSIFTPIAQVTSLPCFLRGNFLLLLLGSVRNFLCLLLLLFCCAKQCRSHLISLTLSFQF